MNIQHILMLIMIIAAFLGATGQIFLKKASSALSASLSGTIGNIWLYAFAAAYGTAVLIQLFAYKAGGKVAFIYPVISLSYIFAMLLASRFLGEQTNSWSIIGAIIIITGVGFIGYGAAQ